MANNVYGITNAKQHWLHLLRRVSHGEVLHITKWGKPVARIVPPDFQNAWPMSACCKLSAYNRR